MTSTVLPPRTIFQRSVYTSRAGERRLVGWKLRLAGKQITSPHTLPGRQGLATTQSDLRQGATLAPGSFVCRIAAATKPFAFTSATNDVT